MATKVFISYRRDDSAGHAGRVHDRLEREFGRDLLFMDVDAIPLGADFVDVLGAEVAKCDVLLAIIGPNWLHAKDASGKRRLDNENDFVRVEIAQALQRGIPVIPILLDGTSVPSSDQLPADMKSLSRRNGLDVRHASFHGDMDRLVRSLRGASAGPADQPAPSDAVAAPTSARVPSISLPLTGAIVHVFYSSARKADADKVTEKLRLLGAEAKPFGVGVGQPGILQYGRGLEKLAEVVRTEVMDIEAPLKTSLHPTLTDIYLYISHPPKR